MLWPYKQMRMHTGLVGSHSLQRPTHKYSLAHAHFLLTSIISTTEFRQTHLPYCLIIAVYCKIQIWTKVQSQITWMSSLITVYTFCYSISIFWMHYWIAQPKVPFLGQLWKLFSPIFKVFMVYSDMSQDPAVGSYYDFPSVI